MESLVDLSPTLLEEARRVARESRLQAIVLLQHYLVEARLHDLMDFVEEVLVGGADPQVWATNDFFCMPSNAWEHLLCRETPALLSPFASLRESTWSRIVPRREDWHFATMGAPGVLIRRPYDWTSPTGTMTVRLRVPIPTEPITDLDVALARWIASRIAWAMKTKGELPRDPQLLDPERVAQFCHLPVDELSDLARHTIAALAHELTSLGWPDDEIPGFRGPDAWYTFRPPSP
jgi:hypothetical protein